jgi:hypothetical protein
MITSVIVVFMHNIAGRDKAATKAVKFQTIA